MSELTDAAKALRQSRSMEEAARSHSAWYLRYLLAFGAAQTVLVPAVLLWHGAAAVAVSTGLFAVVVAVLSGYAARQSAVRRGFALRHTLTIVCWGLLYAGSLLLGSFAFEDSVPFALAAAVCCLLPLAAAAWLEARRRMS